MANIESFVIALIAGLASWWLTGRARNLLVRQQLLDRPNERSLHTQATPRGGGLAVLAAIVPAWIILAFMTPSQDGAFSTTAWAIPAGAVILAAVSFIDDWRGLSQLVRIVAQAVVVVVVVQLLPGPIFQGLLPPLADSALAAIAWLWFINLFNFMDGIDGISGVEAISVGLGVFIVGTVLGPIAASAQQGLVVAAAMAGFLIWNWQPARIFLGDVGSIPVGFLVGWLLLELAASGHWHAAIILPLYYLADATWTLLRRLLRGAAVWRAHREHFYQRAVIGGRSHSTVTRAVAYTNIALIVLAIIGTPSTSDNVLPWLMIAVAAIVVALLLAWMAASDANTKIGEG